MAKLEMRPMPTRKKIIPLVMAIANTIIEKLGFVKNINEAVKWDRSHWNISPGSLCKMLVMGTMSDIRIPLTHIESRLEGIDTGFFLEASDKSTFVNESNVGEALERLGESNIDKVYETMALSAITEYEIPVRRMHSDTTTISFYGEYDIDKMDLNEEEREAVLHIEKGYNKDGRLGCTQVICGQITNEYGLPLINKSLDGATSDIEWNSEAIKYASQLAAAGFTDGIYVADCKLVTEEHIKTMNDPETYIQFVSKCPANFDDKLKERTIKKAYENKCWEPINSPSQAKNAAEYNGISFIEEVCGSPMRLLVLESDTLRYKAQKAAAKKEEELGLLIKTLEKQVWNCRVDAEAEREAFLTSKQAELFDCSVSVEEHIKEKWSKGRRGADAKPTLIKTYHLRVENAGKSEVAYQEYLQVESCIVLISNVTDGMSDMDLLKTYKGQQVIENSFRELKSPQLASVIYLKNPTRIKALNMLLTFSLLLRALIQFRLRKGLSEFKEEHPNQEIYAGWGGRTLKNPTFKLLYEHCVNCCFEREASDKYSFGWASVETRSRVEPLLFLLGLSLEKLLL
jgi:transposase